MYIYSKWFFTISNWMWWRNLGFLFAIKIDIKVKTIRNRSEIKISCNNFFYWTKITNRSCINFLRTPKRCSFFKFGILSRRCLKTAPISLGETAITPLSTSLKIEHSYLLVMSLIRKHIDLFPMRIFGKVSIITGVECLTLMSQFHLGRMNSKEWLI